MKKALVLFTITLLFASCGKNASTPSAPQESSETTETNTTKSQATTTKDRNSEEYLVARVYDIYRNVFTENYDEDADLNDQDMPSPDEKYCTKSWNEILEKVSNYDNMNNPDELGFFDGDYWIMGQDFGDLSVSDVEVIKMDDKNATVSLNLHNFSNTIQVLLNMKYEQNDWFIDNFIDKTNDYNWKKEMEDYIK